MIKKQKNMIPIHQLTFKYLILVAFWMLPLLSIAQKDVATLKLTLADARALAAEKNLKIAAANIDAKMNNEKIAEAKMKRLPQVFADYNIQRNLIIPITPVPANAFNPNAAAGESIPLRFTTKWTSNAGINANFDLFNPQKKLAIQEAQINSEINLLNNSIEAHDISFEVANAYVAALIAAEQLKLAETDTITKHKILNVSQQQFDEGRMLLATLNQLKADRNNTLNSFEEAAKIYNNSKAQLLYAMGFDPESNITIAFEDSLTSLFKTYQKAIDTIQTFSYSLNKLTQNETLLNTQIKANMRGYLPSIALKGYYGANYFDNDFEIFKSTNWNGNSFINLGIRVPITEGLERQKKINQLKLQKQANQFRYDDEKNKNRLDYLAAEREVAVYEKNYTRTLENFKLAEKNLRLAAEQFENGRLLINELHQISFNYQKEKNSYLNMAYNFILGKLKIEKLRMN